MSSTLLQAVFVFMVGATLIGSLIIIAVSLISTAYFGIKSIVGEKMELREFRQDRNERNNKSG